MNPELKNPYSPPTTTSNPIPRRSTKRSILLPTSLVTLLTIAYLTFTILCLSSGGIDQQAGMMLLFNAPILFLWIGLLLCSNSFSTLIGYMTAGVQGLILFGMLIREIGEPTTVLLINGIILVSQGLIAGICHWLHRRANPKPTA